MSAKKQLLLVTFFIVSALLAVTEGPFTSGLNTLLAYFFLAGAFVVIVLFGRRQ